MSRFLATHAVPERVFLEEIVPVHPALVRTPVSQWGPAGNTINGEHFSKIDSFSPST
jgi:hypothetical protein